MNTSTIERFSGFDTSTQLKHIASNLSRLATYWEKSDRDACLEIAREARHFVESAARSEQREALPVLITLDTHLGMVIRKLRAADDISELLPLTRRFSSALLLITEATR